MSLRTRFEALDATWRYALLAGVASMPFTLAAYWQSGMSDEWSLTGVSLAALVAGYLVTASGVDPDAIGFRTGVVGGLPLVTSFAYAVLVDATGSSEPAWFVAGVDEMVFFVVGLVLVVGTLLAFSGLVGLVSASFGAWLADKKDARRQPDPNGG